MTGEHDDTEAVTPTITAWQCIGCGRIEAPQTCIGVCQDRKIDLVTAWDHAEALVALEDMAARVRAFERFAARFAATTPRDDAWKASYLAFQRELRELMAPASAGEPSQQDPPAKDSG
jgi:hypothetical protein